MICRYLQIFVNLMLKFLKHLFRNYNYIYICIRNLNVEKMNIFKKKNLINNYKAELEHLQEMQKNGTARVQKETYNYIGEIKWYGTTICINLVIDHVVDIIARLEKVDTDKDLEYFNY